jgi:hypothetical protein
VHPDDALSDTVRDLLPDSTYEFSLLAENPRAKGNFSKGGLQDRAEESWGLRWSQLVGSRARMAWGIKAGS